MNFSHFIRRLTSFLCIFVSFSACRATKNDESTNFSSNSSASAVEQVAPSPFWDTSDADISKLNPTKKLIAFSFDDAPARNFERLLAVFASFNEANPDSPAYATFFCNGRRCTRSTLPALSAAFALRMELGNHSQNHYDLTKLDGETLREEIAKTDAILREIDGKPTHLFRAPFGRVNDQVREAVDAPIFDWTVDTLDWTGVSADEIVTTVENGIYRGAIVLMHDGYDNTVEAVKRLLPRLKAQGYQVVGISQMAKAHECPLRKGSVYIRARRQV